MSVKIAIGADLAPTSSNYQYFNEGKTERLIGNSLSNYLLSCNFTIFNLEVPLTNYKQPIVKNGPHLIAPISTIKGLKAINPYFFGLANNHILDQGSAGLESTIQLLSSENIGYAGAGKNIDEARKPFVKTINGIRIGIYCCAEHEFSIANDKQPGANPFDSLETFDDILKLKKIADYVIVLYHGGREHYRYPSPRLQKVCRKIVDSGADLVVCQHSHCIGAKEDWRNGTIVYGQGNFLFDDSESDYWKTSLLIELSLMRNNGIISKAIKYIPLQKVGETVREAKEDDAQQILNDFERRSKDILDPQKVLDNYKSLADNELRNYLFTFSGKPNIFRRVLYKFFGYNNNLANKFINRKYDYKYLAAIRNYIECEAHNELLLQGIKDKETNGD